METISSSSFPLLVISEKKRIFFFFLIWFDSICTVYYFQLFYLFFQVCALIIWCYLSGYPVFVHAYLLSSIFNTIFPYISNYYSYIYQYHYVQRCICIILYQSCKPTFIYIQVIFMWFRELDKANISYSEILCRMVVKTTWVQKRFGQENQSLQTSLSQLTCKIKSLRKKLADSIILYFFLSYHQLFSSFSVR